jgi:hypothetical protein
MSLDMNTEMLTALTDSSEGAEDEEGINPAVLAMLVRRRRKARGTAISPLVLAALAR